MVVTGQNNPLYSWTDLAGSARPYPDSICPLSHPDSLTPVMITHVSRHGARFPTTGSCVAEVREFLMKAYDAGQLTEKGVSLLALSDSVFKAGNGNWGRLDSLGEAEQRGIAGALYESAPGLFGKGARISALSSWKPRCVMSMYSFIHQLTLLNGYGLEISTESGTSRADTLMRFFDTDRAYLDLKKNDRLLHISEKYEQEMVNDVTASSILRRLVGNTLPATPDERRWEAMAVYSMIAGCGAMGIDVCPGEWFTQEEYYRCWASKNLTQYLKYSASEVSDIPMMMATPLLKALIAGIDTFVASGSTPPVQLYFGHAETMMPLMTLMGISAANYISPELDSVASHWHNFDLVPMAANITLTLFRSTTGNYYLRLAVNGRMMPVIPGSGVDYASWSSARSYLEGRLAQ